MLYRHLFDKIFTKFRRISRIYLNFAAPRPREKSEALYNTVMLWQPFSHIFTHADVVNA